MIYLDNAATTFPKPFSVGAALLESVARPLGNPGRGTHAASLRAAEAVFEARGALGELFGVSDERRVVLTKNATEALNAAIFGVVPSEGCVDVVTSVLEHNSVLRPLYQLARLGRVRLHFFVPSLDEEECAARFRAACQGGVFLAVLSACANTTGQRLPIPTLVRIARKAGAQVVVDAAQAAGHVPFTMEELGADYLCVPAHKGLYGVTGLGALLLSPTARVLPPLLFGGAGFDSQSAQMPQELPDRMEAGTVNVHGCFALSAGIRFVKDRTVSKIGEHVNSLACFLREELLRMGVSVYSPPESALVLFNVGDLHSAEVSEYLDRHGVCVRAGLHCAPLAHQMLGTGARGAVRVSFGAFNTVDEVERVLRILRELQKKSPESLG